jgi:hypothetical protein
LAPYDSFDVLLGDYAALQQKPNRACRSMLR